MVLKKLVVVGAAAIVAFATVVGCGSDSPPAPSPSATAASDEQQIRDLLEREQAAAADFDFAEVAELTCSKYRADYRKKADSLVPPISHFGTPEELAGKTAALARTLKEEFPTASDASIDRLADALARYDEPAYKKAFLAVLREDSKLTLDRVENIVVTGDSATADVTSTQTIGTDPPRTKTKSNHLVKEGGTWTDCDPPKS